MTVRIFPNIFFLGLWKLLYLVGICGIMAALFFGATEHPFRSNIALVGAFFTLIVAFISYMFARRTNKKYVTELLICYLPFAILWSLALFSSLPQDKNMWFVVLGFFTFVMPFLLLAAEKFVSLSKKRVIEGIKRHWAITIVVVLFVVLCSDIFFQLAICDASQYLDASNNALEQWSFTLEKANTLKLLTHQSFGATLWYLIGASLTPMDPAGLRLINIVLISSAIVCVYLIILKLSFFRKHPHTQSAIASAVFAANPLMLGSIFEINLDIPCMAFYVWMVAAFAYRKNVLVVFSVLSLVFSKEIGVVLLLGFCCGILLAAVHKAITKQKTLWESVVEFKVIALSSIVSIAVFVVMYLYTPKWMVGSEAAERATSAGFHIFGISLDSIVMKLKEMYILNFSWVLLLVALFGVIVLLYRLRRRNFLHGVGHQKKRKSLYRVPRSAHKSSRILKELKVTFPQVESIDVFPIVGSYFAIAAFNFCYITYLNPRYIMFHILGLSFLSIAALVYIFREKKFQFIISSFILIALMLVQNFNTIDPLTLCFFKNINVGETTIITTRTFFQGSEGRTTDPYLISSRELMHGASYNRQYSYFGTVMETFLKDIDYDPDTVVIVDPIYDQVGTSIAFLGKWSFDEDVYYDFSTGRIRQLGDFPKLNIEIAIPEKEINLSDYHEYERVYFLSATYRKEFTPLVPIKGLPILEEGSSECNSWVLNYYRLK